MKKEDGNSILTTPIVIAMGMILVSTLIVMSVKILVPYIWYEKLSSTCIKYVFIMEEYGYLTKKEKTNLMDELEQQGFNMESIKVSATSKIKDYGDTIYLNVEYNYKLELPLIGEKIIPMEVSRNSVCKR